MIDISEQDLSKIYSIEFLNSLCIIKKEKSKRNLLGDRIFSGAEHLTSVCCAEENTTFEFNSDEVSESNIGSEQSLAAEANLHKRIKGLENANKYLHFKIKERDEQLSALLGSTSWRLTSPIRKIGNIIKYIQKKFSRYDNKTSKI